MDDWKNLGKILEDDRKQREDKIADTKELLSYVDENDKEEVKRMLFKGLSPNCSHDGVSPLIATMIKDNLSLGIYLLTCGASASYQPDIVTENAFWYALKNKKYEFLEMFALNNSNVTRAIGDHVPETSEEIPDEQVMSGTHVEAGETALIYATKRSDLRMVEILINHGKVRKKVNEIDRLGRTALHYNMGMPEMSSQDIAIGKLLLAAGADTNIVDLEGLTPDKVAASDTAKSLLLKNSIEKHLDNVEIPEENNEITNDNTLGRSFKL